MGVEEIERILAGLVRVGTVTNVDEGKRMVRVKFQSENMPSGWLRVLASPPFIPGSDEAQRTEFEAGGSGDAAFARHKHDLMIKPWMPEQDAVVLCLYLPMFSGDGFVLGEIG